MRLLHVLAAALAAAIGYALLSARQERVAPAPPPRPPWQSTSPQQASAAAPQPDQPVAMARFFVNTLPDFAGGPPASVLQPGLQQLRQWVSPYLQGPPAHTTEKPTVYTGAAGCAYALWHAHRHAARLADVASEAELLGSAARYARAALERVASQPPERYGWALLAGHAGVYCAGALALGAAADLAQRQGQGERAAALHHEAAQAIQRFNGLQPLACGAACEEDEVLYGRSGYLLGCLLLNRVHPGSVPTEAMQEVVEAIIESGRGLAGRLRDRAAFPTPLFYMWPPGPDASPYLGAAHGLMGRSSAVDCGADSPLFFYWHGKPYLGAAHGMFGILHALLHVPELLAAVPGARADVEGALRYVLSLECDAAGRPGKHGHFPTQMGPWRDREPLVHWCHGATGAVLVFCKAHQQLGDAAYLEAARRAGEAVWQRGLLKKGPGACHGVSGSTYALLRLHRASPPGPEANKWLHRAQQFALFMGSPEFQAGARTPDHPHSLYEGSAAAVCLWADLLGDPGRAAFPMFEVDL